MEVVQVKPTDVVTDLGGALVAPVRVKRTDVVTMGAGVSTVKTVLR
jgi:uncharacterized protein YjlB